MLQLNTLVRFIHSHSPARLSKFKKILARRPKSVPTPDVEVLRKLRAKLAEKRPGKLHHGILFHHNNTPAHSSQIVRDVLREFRWELLPHPPYSPDLAPSDFFLFPKLKEHLKDVYFNDTNEAKQAAKTWLTKWSADDFKNGINGWKHCLEKCIDLDGDYVKKWIDCINKL